MNAQESTFAAPTEPHVMQTYGRLPIALSHGEGCQVWDTAGRRYLDALSGIAVNTLKIRPPWRASTKPRAGRMTIR